MLLHRVAETVGHPLERVLQTIVGERLDPTAVVADEMVMMVLAIRKRDLEARNPIPDLDALDEPQLGQGVEDAIDARDPDLATRGLDAVEDLLRRSAAPLLAQVVEDRSACAPVAEAGAAKTLERMLGPEGGWLAAIL